MTNYYFALDCEKTIPVIISMLYAIRRKATDSMRLKPNENVLCFAQTLETGY